MGYERPGLEIGFLPADIDMSNLVATNGVVWQFQPVWVGPAANIVGQGQGGASLQAIGTYTGPPLGILQNNPIPGEAGLVLISGVSKALAGGTWTVGDPIGWSNTGTLIKAVTGKFAFATALESAVAGDISTVLLVPRGVQ